MVILLKSLKTKSKKTIQRYRRKSS